MNKEDFVSYETAKKLKAAGFDEPCSYYYNADCADIQYTKYIYYNDNDSYCSAPTLWQAAKWLREEKKMHCQVLLNGTRTMYFWQVRELVGNGKYADSIHQYDVFEDAMRDCIDAALDLITNKTE